MLDQYIKPDFLALLRSQPHVMVEAKTDEDRFKIIALWIILNKMPRVNNFNYFSIYNNGLAYQGYSTIVSGSYGHYTVDDMLITLEEISEC